MEEEKRKLTAKEKNVLTIIVALIVLVVFLGISIFDKINESKREMEESMKTVLVTDESRYFTVLGCARKFLDTVQNGTQEEKMSLLKEEYKEQNRIVLNNLNSFLPNLTPQRMYIYTGEEMYQRRLSKNVVEYYLTGSIKDVVFEGDPIYTKYDLTITLYESKFVFAVTPGIGGMNS